MRHLLPINYHLILATNLYIIGDYREGFNVGQDVMCHPIPVPVKINSFLCFTDVVLFIFYNFAVFFISFR